MRIAVNTRLLLPGKLEGIGWFTFESLKRITQQHPEHQFIFFFDRPFDQQFVFGPNIEPVVLPPPTRHPVLWYLWFEWRIPGALKRHKADLFLSPDGYASLRSKVPSVSVIHDINFEHYPQDMPRVFRNYYRKYTPKYARKVTRIATVSEFSKADIAQQYGVDPGKIDVVYNGVNERYGPLDAEAVALTRKTHSEGAPYFLFIGSLHPRKNLARLFQAFDQFRSQADSATKLLIVGVPKWWTGEMRSAYESMKFKDEVLFAGHLQPEELSKVIASARAMTYVSYFEGFGIPILEGFRSEVPVITANVTSMPEVAGDAAVLIDPFSVDSIAEGLSRVDGDADLRQSLVEKGLKRVQDFGWQQTADKLWNCLMKATDA